MQPDIWEEWWRPACVLDMQRAMWSTRCRRACVRSHAERHTGCHQPEADWLVSPINTPRPQLISSHPDLSKPTPREGSVQLKANQMKIISDENQVNTEKASSVQSSIIYDCDAEALSNSIRPSQSYSMMIKWRYCPELVQNHGFRSVEVLLDTSPGSPKNCPEARRGYVRVQISLYRPVSVFMEKPNFCPRQDQSSPVKSSIGFWPSLLRSTSCFSPRTLFPLSLKIVSQREAGLSGVECLVRIWNFIVTLGSRLSLCCVSGADSSDVKSKSGLGTGLGLMCISFPLLEARSWQEAKSNLVTVALGKDDRIASCWTLGPPV
ncbi:hypothetical protein IGI04_028234 [Brassica rapa subsp. trilocularis]|uniref:Uncharacterized protein n=1 Tax=Brassica rapa subsp. trilocularis TaxID=1813537 RepID=A0ABQ7L1C8_BRACM|nr:hypothetical protein IGI04_028234 [Brassica rapa subsp. trilocularis]